MNRYLTLVIAMIAIYSCDLNTCEIYSTGPPILYLEFVDVDSGENIFTIGSYQSSEIQVVNENNEVISFDFIADNDYNIIELIPYSYEESNTIFIKIGETINAKVVFDISEWSSECDTNFYIENIRVENYSYEFVNEIGIPGILKIKV